MNLLKSNNMKQVSHLTGIPWSTIKNWNSGRSEAPGSSSEWKKARISEQLRNLTKDKLQILADSSTSITNILMKFNIDYNKSYYLNILRNRIFELNIDLSTMNNNRHLKRLIGVNSNDELFTANSKISRVQIRRRILAENLIEYKCSGCGIVDKYNGIEISLQLDHINGIRNDHRLENLRWLCPNCHSQQITSFGKKEKIISLTRKTGYSATFGT
ncbi:MAG: HNH endonuclease [Candidatus Omnitrophica bacterium]|nr:HNH endonuclease [Candidatus Omnitrophota bacterium]